MTANDTQVGGQHYKMPGHEEHWDRAWRLKWDPFQYQITKYVERWKDKGGVEDLEKARHFLDKYIELIKNDQSSKGMEQTNWPGYTYEGGSATWDMYKHHDCKTTFKINRGTVPVCPNCAGLQRSA